MLADGNKKPLRSQRNRLCEREPVGFRAARGKDDGQKGNPQQFAGLLARGIDDFAGAPPPGACGEDGFAPTPNASRMISRTSSQTGVEAL